MGSLYILLAILIWSSLGIFVRLLGLPVHLVIFYPALVSAALTGFMLLLKRRGKTGGGSGEKRRRGILYLSILGPLSLLNMLAFFYAYKHTTIANSILTHYIAPVLVAFMAPVFLKERLTKKVMLALAVAVAGLWIMFGENPVAFLGRLGSLDKNTAGIFAGLFSGLVYAVIIIVFRLFAQRFDPVALTFSQNVMMALLLLPFAGVFVFPVDLPTMGVLVLMGVVHSTVAPVLYFKGLETVTAGRAAVIGYMEPVGAVLFGALFLAELPVLTTILGGGLILLSGWFTLKAE